MEQELVDRFIKKQDKLKSKYSKGHPEDYKEIVKDVVELVSTGDYGEIDPERIHEIDDGQYQGTLVYVIAENGYQPINYWYVRVYYGSCSGCDTLEAIRGYDDKKPNQEQVKDYLTLALHVAQGLKKMGDDAV